MLHTKFEQDFGRVSVRQERLELDLPPVESRLPLVVELLEAEAVAEMSVEEVDVAFDALLGTALDTQSFYPDDTRFYQNGVFAEEDAYFAEMNLDEEVGTETYLTLSSTDIDGVIPISDEDLKVSGLRHPGSWFPVSQHDLGHTLSADRLAYRTGISREDNEGLSSWASDLAIQIRD